MEDPVMEETLNKILSELRHIDETQQEIMAVQKELSDRIVNLEKEQKKLITNTRNINHLREELMMGQHQSKIRIDQLENVKHLLLLGQNEIKELIKQTTVYMSGKMSFSEKMTLEIDLLNEQERQEVLNKLNAKTILVRNKTWAENWDDGPYHDF
jgi:hypothetical protein